MIEEVIIIGGGPAGLTAAIYTARANLAPLVLTGLFPGGQLITTTEVENYPGFPTGIMGPELMEGFRKQAARFGAKFLDVPVSHVDFTGGRLLAQAEGEKEVLEARSFIISTGASSRPIGLANERALTGRGVSTCATCDGFFFRGKEIAVVGGGDSAPEEANFLTKFASKVTVVHRRGQLRASQIMQRRAMDNPKVAWRWNSVVTELLESHGKLDGVKLRNVETGVEDVLPVAGVFVAIGHVPSTRLFEGQLPMDENGYLLVEPGSTRTRVPGVFAAGDCVDHVYRQAVTAAGMGCMAAIDVERYLTALEG